MSLPFYFSVHVFAVLLLFVALGGAALHNATGGTAATNPKRGLIAATHGAALLLLLITGFGAAGKGGAMAAGFPGWIGLKLVIWLLLGAAIVPLNRKPGFGLTMWIVLPSLGALAGYLAKMRPF